MKLSKPRLMPAECRSSIAVLTQAIRVNLSVAIL